MKIEGRILEGYAVLWYEPIQGENFYLKPGSLTWNMETVRLFFEHANLIGRPLEITPDAKGIYVKCYVARTRLGDDIIKLIEDKVLTGWSVGFNILQRGRKRLFGPLDEIVKAELFDISVTWKPRCQAAVGIDFSALEYHSPEILRRIDAELQKKEDDAEQWMNEVLNKIANYGRII